MASHTPSAPWSLTYHDGSGNGFRFWQEAEQDTIHFAYTPMTPEMSSSGTYSGGAPKKGTMTDQQATDLWKQVEHLEADTTLHAASRMMGSGTFKAETAAGARTFIVKNSEALRMFNERMLPFRGE